MVDALQELLVLLAMLIGFLFKVGIPFVVGCVVGWLLAVAFRRSKAGGTSSEELEATLSELKTQVNKVGREADRLYQKVGWTTESSATGSTVKERSYQGSRRSGGPGKLLGKLRAFFRAEDVKAHEKGEAGVNTLEQRLTEIRLQVTDIKTKLRNVGPRLIAAPWKQGSGRQSPALTSAQSPAEAVEDIKEMEWFSQNHPTRDPGADSAQDSVIIDHSYYDARRREQEQFDPRNQDAGHRPTSGVGAEIVEMYNRAVADPLERGRFRDKFTPVRVGTLNAVGRRQNPTIEAEYGEASDGDFFAYPIGGGECIVVPSLGLTIEAVGWTAGALGEVFGGTRGHDPQRFYSSYRVREPARFRCQDGRWELGTPGELDLGPGD
jgi:hypothetical protein